MEVWTVALAVEAPAAPKGTTHGGLCRDVRKTLQKCVPQLPTKAQLDELEMEDDEALVVISDQEENEPFNAEEDVSDACLRLPREHSPLCLLGG